MPANPTQTENTADREIVITKILDAPRERVFQAMTDPEQVVRWWGPFGFTVTNHEMDVRPGGVWKRTLHGPDGTNYINKSVYDEVVKPERVTFTHAGGEEGTKDKSTCFKGIWIFEEEGKNKTKLTMKIVFQTPEARKECVEKFGAVEGGHQTLTRLAEYLATGCEIAGPIVLERVYNARPEMIWKALTEKDRMQDWYFKLAEFKAEPGFEFRFEVEHEGHHYIHLCKVKEVIPGEKISYTWRYEGQPGDSLVSFELFPQGSQTKVRLVHEGLDTFPKLPEYDKKNFLQGWTHILGTSLKQYLGK
jgi:uncharacterized protein YndB with AHSA1/START domain